MGNRNTSRIARNTEKMAEGGYEHKLPDDDGFTRIQSGPLTFVFNGEDFEVLETTPSIQEAIYLRQKSKEAGFDFGYHSYCSQTSMQEEPKPPLLVPSLDEIVWTNPASNDVHSVESCVERYVEQILRDMKESNEKWDFKLIKCGSYYEGLRVGLPYEFDYMLEIPMPAVPEIIPDINDPLGSIQVRLPNQDESQVDYLTEFMSHMIPALRNCIRQRDRFNGLKYLEVLDHYNRPNVCLFFEFNKGTGVMIDLVPCIKFPYDQKHKLPTYLEETLTFLHKVIPGADDLRLASEFISNNLYMVATSIHSRWRISTSIVELHVMKNLPEEFKRPMRVLKYLCSTHLIHSESYQVRHTATGQMMKLFGYKPFLPSYVIKLLFLYHVSHFYNQSECQSPGMYHNDTTGLLQLLIKDLKRFKTYISLPVERCTVEIHSPVFGKRHNHKFDFVQYFVLKNISKNIGWYDMMLNTIELILDEEIQEEDLSALRRKFHRLSHPRLEGVRCYVNQPGDI